MCGDTNINRIFYFAPLEFKAIAHGIVYWKNCFLFSNNYQNNAYVC